jgi:hypothetical protein
MAGRGCVRELIDRLDRLYSYGFGDLPMTAASVFAVSDEIVAQKSRRMDHQGAVLQITPWERDVLQLLADGRATNEIATHLGMRTPDFESGLTRPQWAPLPERKPSPARSNADCSPDYLRCNCGTCL